MRAAFEVESNLILMGQIFLHLRETIWEESGKPTSNTTQNRID